MFCILYGAVTVLGFLLVILPTQAPEAVDIALGLGFAVSFVLGGILAILNRRLAVAFLVASCFLYLGAGMHHPIREFGLSSLTGLDNQFYYSLALRCAVTAILSYIMMKQLTSHAAKRT